MTKPAIVTVIETKCKDGIQSMKACIEEHGSTEFRMEELRTYEARLKSIQRLWRKLGANPVVQQMAEIASKKINAYHEDFLHDLEALAKHPDYLTNGFVWVVRDMGTHLHGLTGKPQQVAHAIAWTKCYFPNGTLKSDHEAYICVGGKLKRVSLFDHVPFKVTDPEAIEILQENENQWYVYKAGVQTAMVEKIYDRFYLLWASQGYDRNRRQEIPTLEHAVVVVSA
jgi:hypothetical protein